jgi:hypothetical protein
MNQYPNPLSGEQLVYCSDDNKKQIKNDVVRTNQEIAFFRQKNTQRSLRQILNVWNFNNDNQYKQGMNEIAAIIFLVFSMERSDAVIGCHPDSLHADVFMCFSQVMLLTSELYDEHSTILRCKRIYDGLLIKLDPELYQHLAA